MNVILVCELPQPPIHPLYISTVKVPSRQATSYRGRRNERTKKAERTTRELSRNKSNSNVFRASSSFLFLPRRRSQKEKNKDIIVFVWMWVGVDGSPSYCCCCYWGELLADTFQTLVDQHLLRVRVVGGSGSWKGNQFHG